ncbi:hypothetical protein [Nitrosomonas oligotropha]|uniref:hypothetical protein n=1 Tax=Nitrosomonas oligotropha TaxID=42354 RepID=UPI00136CBB67|nr:hypothetical protein [Nitrosomonas oligotropha]MXS82282.1 hypothetical protein [Nitrosomonas oligotropha]
MFGGTQFNLTGWLGKLNSSLIVDNWTDLPTAALNPGKFMRVRNVGYAGADVVARNDEWYFRNGEIVLGIMTGVPKAWIVPAATFTGYTLSSAAGGNRTLITAGGAHGLTNAFATTPTKSIYVSGGAGWIPGFYDITAIPAPDSTGTSIEINLSYDPGRLAPIIALPNDFVPFLSLSVPPLLDNSCFSVITGYDYTNSAVSKTPIVRLTDGVNNMDAFASGITTQDSGSYITTIRNKGSKTAQINAMAAGHGIGVGSTALPATAGTVNTASGSTLIIGGKLSAAMAFMRPNLAIVRLAR